jgi:hypothetical protein
MATLSVLKFDDPYGADLVLMALEGLQEQGTIELEDAAVVSWPLGSKKPSIRQLHSMAGVGAVGGAFWGFLLGLIFFVPFLGAAIGAGMGAHRLFGRHRDRRRLHQAGERGGDGGQFSALHPHQRGEARQGGRRAKAVQLRSHLDQPVRGAGKEVTRGIRPRVVRGDLYSPNVSEGAFSEVS